MGRQGQQPGGGGSWHRRPPNQVCSQPPLLPALLEGLLRTRRALAADRKGPACHSLEKFADGNHSNLLHPTWERPALPHVHSGRKSGSALPFSASHSCGLTTKRGPSLPQASKLNMKMKIFP